ncbi:neuromedin-B receptor-like [Asterias rubens]|uniref:neuromedin-B receptor-like n=1 Tax=Asterias rubens TaxID=7604 RepID=UPI0014558E91|nr:neuromedin-B receptor-like [Asterias rubens]
MHVLGIPSRAMEFLGSDYNNQSVLFDEDADIVVPIIVLVVQILGIVGNTSVILIILGFRDMRNIPNLQILSMAIGDFVFLVMNVPDAVAFNFLHTWPFSDVYCRITLSSIYISQGVSVLTLSALSADRYYAIARPMARRKINVANYTLAVVVAIWVMSFLCGIPAFFMADTNGFCTLPYQSYNYKVYLVLQFVGLYVIPLALITMFYSLTAHTLIRGVKTIGQKVRDGNGRRDPQSQARRRLAIIVLVAVVCFAVCWGPYHVYDIWAEFETDISVFLTPGMTFYLNIKYLLPPLSASLNPIVLYVMSSNYRRHFKRMFLSWCPCCRDSKQPLTHTWTLLTAFKTMPTSRRSSAEFQLKHSSSTLVSHS